MNKDIALLVVGDPLGATTHTDMLLRARQYGVEFQVFKFKVYFLTPARCKKWGASSFVFVFVCISLCGIVAFK